MASPQTQSIKDIRTLSYNNVRDESMCTSKKWRLPKDEIFNKLGELMPEYQIKIADFLNLFYYFIICYSKTCFKKYGNWTQPRWRYRSNCQNIANSTLFRYDLANQTESHQQLLEIQTRMYQYRQEYDNVAFTVHKENYNIKPNYAYFTDFKRTELLQFIDESIGKLCTDIKDPVVLISQDIKNKIDKYIDIYTIFNDNVYKKKHKQKQKSSKINYEILERICTEQGIDINTIIN
jgi:hypothetical protein